MSRTKILIDFVEDNPIIYDRRHPRYKDLIVKDWKWMELATTLNIDYDILKRQWKNLKDSYSRHLKSRRTGGQVAKKYYHWQWAKQMAFVKPHIAFAHKTFNLKSRSLSVNIAKKCEQQSCEQSEGPTSPDIENIIVSNRCSVSLNDDIHLNTSTIDSTAKTKEMQHIRCNNIADQQRLSNIIPKSRNNSSTTSNVDEVISCRQKRNEMDAIDHLFISWAETIKTFTPVRLLETKIKIAHIVMHQEKDQLQEDTMNLQPLPP